MPIDIVTLGRTHILRPELKANLKLLGEVITWKYFLPRLTVECVLCSWYSEVIDSLRQRACSKTKFEKELYRHGKVQRFATGYSLRYMRIHLIDFIFQCHIEYLFKRIYLNFNRLIRLKICIFSIGM